MASTMRSPYIQLIARLSPIATTRWEREREKFKGHTLGKRATQYTLLHNVCGKWQWAKYVACVWRDDCTRCKSGYTISTLIYRVKIDWLARLLCCLAVYTWNVNCSRGGGGQKVHCSLVALSTCGYIYSTTYISTSSGQKLITSRFPAAHLKHFRRVRDGNSHLMPSRDTLYYWVTALLYTVYNSMKS